MSQQWKGFKQRYYRNLNNLSLFRPVLLSGNVQSEHVAAGEGFSNNNIMETLTLQNFVGQCYFQVMSNRNMSQQGKFFKQRYYRNINILSSCRPFLLSGNVLSEHVAAGEVVQTTILSEHYHFRTL